MIYALYDDEDNVLGTFNQLELEQLLNTTKDSFRCIISRLKNGKHKRINYKGKSYMVYMYKESDSNG